MKKYYPVDFDDKGNAVLGTPKNTPTSNGFIPTTWAPGGSDAGNGIKSITISPAISTTPALDSLFPIYWDDLTDEEKNGQKTVTVNSTLTSGDTYTATFTPSPDWYLSPDMGETWGAQGESGETESMVVDYGDNNVLMFNTMVSSDSSGDGDYFELTLYIVEPK